jgi:DNA-binding transcriptional ArsR family regulator
MAYSKSEEFSDMDVQLAKIAKALSHPARIAIIKILARQNTCQCSFLVEELPLSQSTVSQHLKELKDAGLIQGEINPPKIKYCINKQNFELASSMFRTFFE